MQYSQNYSLKNSFNLPCNVQEIWFPETYCELLNIFTKEKLAPIIADCTNIICRPQVKKAICLIKMPQEIILINEDAKYKTILCDANVKSNQFVQYLLLQNIGGYENLYGMPGRLGSAIYGNSGSGNVCFSDYLDFIFTIDRIGKTHYFQKKDLKFKRRYSILQELNHVVTEIGFVIPKHLINKEKLNQAKEHRKNIPVPSVGGIFRNWYHLKPYVKDLTGLRIGDMEVSNMVNIIRNRGNGTYRDVLQLITKIQDIVPEHLELEIKIL